MVVQAPSYNPKTGTRIVKAFIYNSLFNIPNVVRAAQICWLEDLQPMLSQTQVPSLVLWGEKDLFIPLEIGKIFTEKLPLAQSMELKNKYHEWSMFHPEDLTAVVIPFIDQVEKHFYLNE